MRKQIFGRKFKRDKNARKALFNGLISAMVLNGSIKTTEQKAKAIKGDLEKLVTKAKKEKEVAKKLLQSSLKNNEIEKMINVIAPGFKNRAGGYTRIIKTGRRFNDDASMVILQWVEMEKVEIINQKPASLASQRSGPAGRSNLKNEKKVSLKKTPKLKRKPAGKSLNLRKKAKEKSSTIKVKETKSK